MVPEPIQAAIRKAQARRRCRKGHSLHRPHASRTASKSGTPARALPQANIRTQGAESDMGLFTPELRVSHPLYPLGVSNQCSFVHSCNRTRHVGNKARRGKPQQQAQLVHISCKSSAKARQNSSVSQWKPHGVQRGYRQGGGKATTSGGRCSLGDRRRWGTHRLGSLQPSLHVQGQVSPQ